ncbi:hypothetical protein MaudMau93_007867 [Microsporum audouinii]
MEVYYHEYDPNSAPQVSLPDGSQKEVVKPTVSMAAIYEPPRQSSVSLSRAPWKRRRFIIVAVALAAVIIAVAVTVGVVVGLRNSKGASSSTFPSNPTGSESPGSYSDPPYNLVDEAWAYNGTAISSLTYSPARDQDSAATNYIVFYQHSNGELRRSTWNNSQWHDSQFITNDARPRTPLSSYWRGEGDGISFNLFYVDKNKVLQEIRGSHSSNDWINGTLGELGIAVDPQSAISVQFVGKCRGVDTAWLVYHTGKDNEARVVYWNAQTDRWSAKETIGDVSATAGFSGEANDGHWRFYYVSKRTQQLNVMVCPDCCSNTSTKWEQNINGPSVSSENGGIAVTPVGGPRILFYLDDDGTVRELNNTDTYPHETWIEDASSTSSGGNRETRYDTNASVGPEGSRVIKAIPGGRVSMAAGFRGKIQQLWLFYQSNGTDISTKSRDADAAGKWSAPVALKI